MRVACARSRLRARLLSVPAVGAALLSFLAASVLLSSGGCATGLTTKLELTQTPTPRPTPTSTPQTHALHGALLLMGDSKTFASISGRPCQGTGGYSDITAGTQVVVKNAQGTVIAIGQLNTGLGAYGGCSFTFDITGLPDSTFYSVEVGHRGALTYSKADMESHNWTFSMSLGTQVQVPAATGASQPPPPTQAPLPDASLSHPMPRGTPVAEPNGWEVTVLDYVPDAWSVVQGSSQANKPPDPGYRMIMVRIRVRNLSAGSSAEFRQTRLKLITPEGVVRATSDRPCGQIPEGLAPTPINVGAGESVDGNLCFQVLQNEGGLVLFTDFAFDKRIAGSVKDIQSQIDQENTRWVATLGLVGPTAEEVVFHQQRIANLTDEMNKALASAPYNFEMADRRYLALE